MQTLVPVITKELYHYAILSTMREGGLSRLQLVFQGGTSLRLCHRSPRYSEGPGLRRRQGLRTGVLRRDGQGDRTQSSPQCPRFQRRDPRPQVRGAWSTGGASASVPRAAHEGHAQPDHQTRGRRHPAYDPYPRPLRINYRRLYGLFDRIPITVESLDEIMADKMLSYVAANHMRYRDLWDMGWIGAKRLSDRSNVWDMLDRKQDDYSEKPDWASRLSGTATYPRPSGHAGSMTSWRGSSSPRRSNPPSTTRCGDTPPRGRNRHALRRYITHMPNHMDLTSGFTQEAGRIR